MAFCYAETKSGKRNSDFKNGKISLSYGIPGRVRAAKGFRKKCAMDKIILDKSLSTRFWSGC